MTVSAEPPVFDEGAARREIAGRRLSAPQSWRSAGHLAVAWGLYAACAVVAVQVDNWAVRVVVWFAMAWLLLGNGAVVHETLHRHLFRAPWMNRMVGVIAGTSVGLPFSMYRCYHLGHHQYSCTADDPEGAPYLFRSRAYYLLIPVGGPLFALQFVWWTLATLAGRPPKFVRSRRQVPGVVVDGLVSIAFYAAMVLVGVWSFEVLACVWLVPWLVTVVVLEPFVLIPEHYGASAERAALALATTRTVQSNPLVTWVYWGNNLHTAHHLAGGVVPQHIGEVTQEFVLPNVTAEWSAPGYVAFHWRLLRTLPWRPAKVPSDAA